MVLAFVIVFHTTALAYERPGAVSLGGEWEFCPVAPMIDIVPDRYVRPDFPQLSPSWDEVIDPQAAPPADAQWMDVTVPMAWENYLGAGYNEAGWYRKTIRIPEKWQREKAQKELGGRRYWLEFDAVATAAGVWVNGEFAGGHVGDYSRWRVEITDVVGVGHRPTLSGDLMTNQIPAQGGSMTRPYGDAGNGSHTIELLVYVDELPGHITQGFLSMIAPHHGGIGQDVRMYCSGAVSIVPDGVSITHDFESATTTIQAELDIPAGFQTDMLMFVFIDESSGATVTNYSTPGLELDHETGLLSYSLEHSDFNPWTPDQPTMRKFEVQVMGPGMGPWDAELRANIGADVVRLTTAFRDIRMEGSQVLLNGTPIRIRSVLNWGYYPGVYGPAPAPETVREEFAYIKSLGFNAETVCLINMPDYFYDIADEMGVLIWQEYPTWHNDFDAKHLATYRREFPAYLRRDRNHPSIIMRSLSVEAGVADWEVIDELYALAKEMTNTPVQDNNSWFSHSRPEYTDWYGEDNYFNNAQWARHLLERLPKQLDEYPEKPYIIGESILFNTWPDIDALEEFLGYPVGQAAVPAISPVGRTAVSAIDSESQARCPAPPPGSERLPAYLGGPSDYPWWFPSCYESVKEINAKLRERYNPGLPHGKDIVNDYLIPQSTKYALESRRFQIEMLDSDPRYAGYTVNCVRDMPLIRAGLLDSLDRPRWTPGQWAWHSEKPEPGGRDSAATKLGDMLADWDPGWEGKMIRDVPVLGMRDGYLDLEPIVGPWNVRWIKDWELDETRGVPLPTEYSQVVVTSVLTHKLVDYIEQGGVVILLTSKWPGGLGSYHHYFWRDSIFVPPVGPWLYADKAHLTLDTELPLRAYPFESSIYFNACNEIISLQPYSLNYESTNVIPVNALGIGDSVDPLIRLYDTHDLSRAVAFDQIFATKVGEGLFIASSLDHSTNAGKYVLGMLARWSKRWLRDESYWELLHTLHFASEGTETWPPKVREFPQTSVSVEKLHELAVSRPNGIMPLDEGWAFSLDEAQVGASEGWMLPGYDVSAWDTLRAGTGWESQGYSYDGMAWYIRELDVPENWAGGKLRLVAEGIDDAYTVWVNGVAVATHGSFTVHEETVWLQQTVTDLTGYLIPGEMNTLALQVVDIVGQGGIWRPIYLAVDE